MKKRVINELVDIARKVAYAELRKEYLENNVIPQARRILKEIDNPIIAIYDNGGKTFDRYTVYFSRSYMPEIKPYYGCFGMSEKPQHPQGFGQHSKGTLGRHNGKRIAFNQLPDDCQKALKDTHPDLL